MSKTGRIAGNLQPAGLSNLIDPYQFRDMFAAARSIAVVGNAPSVLEWQNGRTIDAHDLVVRFNLARTAGFEEYVGARTDVLVVNAGHSLATSPPPREVLDPRCLVCFMSPLRFGRHPTATAFREWVGDCPILWSFGPDPVGLPGRFRSKALTMGTYALFALLQIFDVQKLFVTGFTMFGAVPGGLGPYWDARLPSAARWHDLNEEGQLFATILERFRGDLTVTDEVLALARRHGVQLAASGSGKARIARLRRSFGQRLAAGLATGLIETGMLIRRSTGLR